MKRPGITKEIILEAAKVVAKKLNADAETIAEHYTYGTNGYELAKDLEMYAYWDVDANTVAELDEMDYLVHREHEKICKKWVEENNIQPPMPIGTKITRGVIEGICEYSPAKYKVKENGCTKEGRWLLINFEDAVPV